MLQQSALSENDAFCPVPKQAALVTAVLEVHDLARDLARRGVPASVIEDILQSGREMLAHPVELLPDVDHRHRAFGILTGHRVRWPRDLPSARPSSTAVRRPDQDD